MLEYNYIYNYLNRYGSYINGVAQGSEEWRDVTTNFAKDLYEILYNEEKYLLGKIKPTASSTYKFKWSNEDDIM